MGKLSRIVDNPHVLNQIVQRGLCVRCGACAPACPVDIIRFDESAYPLITKEDDCLRGCTRCIKVCPGEEVRFDAFDDEMFGQRPDPDSVTGIAKRALVSFATDERVRYDGASGGFVTQLLLYLLNGGVIDGALVLGASNESDGWRERPFIARSAEQLRAAAKSKYLAVPFLAVLKEIEEVEGSYAVVALPCYVHAIRKYQQVSRILRQRIKLVIGLFCNAVLEPYMFDEACEFNGLDRMDVADFCFRHGDWPGGVHARLRGGGEQKILALEEWKDEFNLLKLFYVAPRCNMCTDFSAEYADLAVGDPWIRGPDGKYLFEDGRTVVLVRTELGAELVKRASAGGWLSVKEISLETFMVNFEFSGRYKRDFVGKNLRLRQLFGMPSPRYDRRVPLGKLSSWVSMLARTAVLRVARHKWFRKLGLTLTQSRPAVRFFRWNRRGKEKRFARSYAKRLAFVEKLKAGLTTTSPHRQE